MCHLVLEETVLQGFVARVAASALEQQLVLLRIRVSTLHSSNFSQTMKMYTFEERFQAI